MASRADKFREISELLALDSEGFENHEHTKESSEWAQNVLQALGRAGVETAPSELKMLQYVMNNGDIENDETARAYQSMIVQQIPNWVRTLMQQLDLK